MVNNQLLKDVIYEIQYLDRYTSRGVPSSYYLSQRLSKKYNHSQIVSALRYLRIKKIVKYKQNRWVVLE